MLCEVGCGMPFMVRNVHELVWVCADKWRQFLCVDEV